MRYLLFLLLFVLEAYSSPPIDFLLSQFERPFTMVSFGDDTGSTLKAAEAYPDSVFIVVNGQEDTSLSNLIVLSKEITENDIRILGQCEDFDVVYCPNFAKAFGKQSQSFFKELENLGRYSILERAGGLLFFKTEKPLLLRKTWERQIHSEKSHHIHSTLREKKLIKSNKALLNHVFISDWKPGINLISFKMLGGVFPTKKMLEDLLLALKDTPHNDWVINNMILQGNKLVLVDFNDPRRGEDVYCSDEVFNKHIMIMNIDDTEEIYKILIAGIK